MVAFDVTVKVLLPDWLAVASIEPLKPRPEVLPSIWPLFAAAGIVGLPVTLPQATAPALAAYVALAIVPLEVR